MNNPLGIPGSLRKQLSSAARSQSQVQALVRKALERVAPAFDIRDMVAVNPLLGFAELSFLPASELVEQLFHVDLLPERGNLVQAYRRKDFDDLDVLSALGEFGPSLGVSEVEVFRYLDSEGPAPRGGRALCILDQVVDCGAQLVAQGLVQSVTRFLAARYDLESARWRSPIAAPLLEAYRHYAMRDRSSEILGLRGFRKWVSQAPSDPMVVLETCLGNFGLDDEASVLYLGRLIARLNGWASFLRNREWLGQGEQRGEVASLLAILALIDVAPREVGGYALRPLVLPAAAEAAQDRRLRLLLLRAREQAFVRGVVRKVAASPSTPSTRPSMQAVFCIDVRSERLRRHLEANDPHCDTYGFAGFFGLPVSFSGVDRSQVPHCPPLIRPTFEVNEINQGQAVSPGGASLSAFVGSLKRGPVGALQMVETLGFGSGFSLIRDALWGAAQPARGEPKLDVSALSLDEKVRLGAAILKNLGLRRPLARLVFLVGHDSHVTNNPQCAGLACGACAGHGGDKNAMLASLILNDLDVRDGLAQQGQDLPPDVLFVPLLHETTTDVVSLVAPSQVPESHEEDILDALSHFEKASAAVRAERAREQALSETGELAAFQRRAASVSEVRPEWGLAGNVAFIVARRARTKGAVLSGRTFLHSYDEAQDADGSVLELILTAPAIVGSWINLQYYASSVAPTVFGSGRKTLHNVVGGFGIVEGNEGDLAVGLSWESVSDGVELVHQPLRLQLIVEASEARISAIVRNHETLGQLVRGEWVALYALDRGTEKVRWFHPSKGFLDFTPPLRPPWPSRPSARPLEASRGS